MEDTGTPNPLFRRKSIAGPFMRSSTGIPAPPERRGSTSASTSTTHTTPAPLTRANTVSGSGWFGGWFSRRTSISQSTDIPKTSMDDSDLDNHANLASSAPGVVAPPKADSRELMNSTGALPRSGASSATADRGNMPPLPRRLSQVALQKPLTASGGFGSASDNSENSGAPAAAAAPAAASASAAKKPSLLEADLRQGPIENDLFWTVLREIGE